MRIDTCYLCNEPLETEFDGPIVAAMRAAGWDRADAPAEQRAAYECALDAEPEQFENALHIAFDGGYGMFIDVLPPEPAPRVILCGDCAHALVEREPWIDRLLDISGRIHNSGCALCYPPKG
jgi:hypothetical protein